MYENQLKNRKTDSVPTMLSSDECNRSVGTNSSSSKICEFSDDDLNIDIDELMSEV